MKKIIILTLIVLGVQNTAQSQGIKGFLKNAGFVSNDAENERRFKEIDSTFGVAKHNYKLAYQTETGFYDFATDLWTDSFSSKLQEADSIMQEYNKEKSSMDRLYFSQDMHFFTKTNFSLRTKEFVEKTKAISSRNKVKDYTYICNLQDKAKGLLVFYPENQELQQRKQEIDQIKSQIENQIEGILVSEFHRMHMNQIFFSDHIVEFGNESKADFKTKFDLGQPIYATVYLDYNIDPTLEDGNEFLKLSAGKDEFGALKKYHRNDLSKENPGVFHFLLFPGIGKMSDATFMNDIELKSNKDVAQFFHLIGELAEIETDGNIEILMDAGPEFGYVFKKGEFSLNIKNKEAFFEELQIEKVKAEQNLVLPSAGRSINNEALSMAKKQAIEDGHNVISGKCMQEWAYDKWDYTGVIKKRYVSSVELTCKDEKGQCYILYLYVSQVRNDNKYASPNVFYNNGHKFQGISVPQRDDKGYTMNCANVN